MKIIIFNYNKSNMKVEARYIQSLNREIPYLVGSNAQDNFDIIDESDSIDIWFHIEGQSSCHVVAKMPQDIKLNKKQKLQIIKQGALICKQNSKYKSLHDVPIVYTQIVNITKKDKIGQVETQNSKIIAI